MNVILRVTAGPHEGNQYVFDRHETFVVGRSSQAQFSVQDDGFLSRHHFLIEFNPPTCFLKDLGSTNGTKVNGVRVDGIRLRDGDVVEAGQSTFVVEVQETWAAFPRVRCLGCDCPAPADTAVAARPGDETIHWICDTCAAQRRLLPPDAPGYWIECRIGGGGMGEVYKARRLADNKQVAIKMMIPSVAASDRARTYFKRELDVLRNLRHPNIVEFYDAIVLEDQFQLIMEFVDGKGAREWAEAQPQPLAITPALRIGIQLLMALDHAHSRGYVHRDIKPSNILVMGPAIRPVVKLSDFGLAKSFRDNAGFAGLTHQGDVGGSVGFLSPDHIRGFREVRASADLYSAGATLYYLLSGGQYPYLDFCPQSAEAYSKILEHPTVPLRAHRPDVPDELDRILRKSLEKQPRDRWRSAAEMAAALQTLLKSSPESAHTSQATP